MFIKLSFGIMIAGVFIIGWLLFNDPNFPDKLLFPLAQLFSLPFIVTAVVELNSSNRIDKKEKTMWTFGFIALTLITGVLYFISERKRVVAI
jgi:hypothetical protein